MVRTLNEYKTINTVFKKFVNEYYSIGLLYSNTNLTIPDHIKEASEQANHIAFNIKPMVNEIIKNKTAELEELELKRKYDLSNSVDVYAFSGPSSNSNEIAEAYAEFISSLLF
jgi:hypothetical protein